MHNTSHDQTLSTRCPSTTILMVFTTFCMHVCMNVCSYVCPGVYTYMHLWFHACVIVHFAHRFSSSGTALCMFIRSELFPVATWNFQSSCSYKHQLRIPCLYSIFYLGPKCNDSLHSNKFRIHIWIYTRQNFGTSHVANCTFLFIDIFITQWKCI